MTFPHRTPLSPFRPTNKKIWMYGNGGGKNLYAAPPLALQKLQVVRVQVMEKMLCLRHAAATVSIIVGTATPHQYPDVTKPLSTSVAFFVTLQFSNVVPYVSILKTFHVKNYIDFLRKTPPFP